MCTCTCMFMYMHVCNYTHAQTTTYVHVHTCHHGFHILCSFIVRCRKVYPFLMHPTTPFPSWEHVIVCTFTSCTMLSVPFVQSFVVRGSQKAKYALSLRILTDDAEDAAVKHFLIQINQQSELSCGE